jgi:hypothetical protein
VGPRPRPVRPSPPRPGDQLAAQLPCTRSPTPAGPPSSSSRPSPAPCSSSGSTPTASNRSATPHRPMERDEPKRRHVWVDCSGGFRYPGLVIAWRRTADGWEAYVAILQEGSVLVTWEKAADLHPVQDEGWSKQSSSRRPGSGVAKAVMGQSSPMLPMVGMRPRCPWPAMAAWPRPRRWPRSVASATACSSSNTQRSTASAGSVPLSWVTS